MFLSQVLYEVDKWESLLFVECGGGAKGSRDPQYVATCKKRRQELPSLALTHRVCG